MFKSAAPLFAACVASFGMSAALQAATISYGAAQQISADSDVSNTGSTVRAYTFSTGNTTTINGVTFSPFASGTDTLTFTNNFGSYSSGSDPYNSLPSELKNLITGGVYTDSNAGSTTATFTFGGLTVGQQYQVQEFVNDSRSGPSFRQENIDGNLVKYNTAVTEGGVGQYLVGTFTADAATQVITFSDVDSQSGDVQLNGIQLRSVPEPTSIALFGSAAIGLLARRRRLA